MSKVVISDTSCLILLQSIGQLGLLEKLFGKVFITNVIAAEYELQLPDYISVRQPSNKTYQTILETFVDRGEASAIALGLEIKDALIIIDDLKGRKCAQRLGLKITGTLGVILDARLTGIVDSVKPLLEEIKRTDFRISDELEKRVLFLAGEE